MMMKFASVTVLLVLSMMPLASESADTPNTCSLQNAEDFCSCAECYGYDPVAGTVFITLSACNKKSISWMCCATGGCSVVNSNSDKPGKMDSAGLIQVNVPAGATEVILQLHDGQNNGAGGSPPSNNCAGNAGGQCNNGMCQTTISLARCHSGYIGGDPHIKNWRGDYFDYHGECDLNLVSAPRFDGLQDLDIHVRTKIQHWYSYVEAAAIRIGDDILEVAAYGDYALNGVEGAIGDNGAVPRLGGYPINYRPVSKKKHIYDIILSEQEKIRVTSYKSWVGVNILGGSPSYYGQVSGLMGSYEGKMLTHAGEDLHENMDAFGEDWQIKDTDPKLFRSQRAPQWPEQCHLPQIDQAQSRRRLEEGAVKEEDAKVACADKKGMSLDHCIYDVLATQDLDMANAGTF